MNPLESLLQGLFNTINNVPDQAKGGALLLAIGFIMMLWNVSRQNMLGGQDRTDMRKWSDMSCAMNSRIANLTPHYAAAISLVAKEYGRALQANKSMLDSIKSTDPRIKEKAELDYCSKDAGKDTTVALLSSKLEALLKNQESV